jgi:Ca2+-binding RTX toxin-like protein
MRRRSAFQKVTAVVAASATAFALAGVAAPPSAASAPDPGVPQLKVLVQRLSDVTETLGAVGRLAEPIPTVGTTVGQAAGYADLVEKTVRDNVADRQHWGDFDETIDLAAAGQTGTLTLSTSDDPERVVRFELDVTRTLASQPFSFAHETPKVSLSSPAGVEISARTRLAFDIVVEQSGPGTFSPYLVAGAGGPTLAVDVTADIPGSATLSAAVGILGVDLTETSPDTSQAIALHLVGTIADPDGDGRLYATKPDGTAGELAGEGVAAGLFTVDFAPTGGGSVDLALRILASGADPSFNLPTVDATVTVTWPDIAIGTPSVQVTGLDPVQAFQNLSMRDLADLLGQIATTIAAAQRDNGGNIDLPFLSGTLADAVKASESLVAFLEEWVQPALAEGAVPDPSDPPAGTPLFSSIQDLVDKLNAALDQDGNALVEGADIVAEVTGYDATNARLPIHLELSRTSTDPQPVVEQTVATSGIGAYGPSTLTAAAPFAAELVGRRVTAGSSGGTIASVAGPVLTLSEPWTGGQPVNGTPYAIAGPEVDAGSVNLADLLAPGGKGIKNANAIRSTAQVTPSYAVELDLALDLSAPRTGEDCTDGPGDAACPYERQNADGSSTVVAFEPLPVDRLLIANSGTLLSASFPMTAGVDLHARAGFLGVRLAGDVKVCHSTQVHDCTGTASEPMLSVDLTPLVGEADGELIPVKDFFDTIVDADGNPQRFAASSDVRGYVSGSVSVPEAEEFLGDGTAGFTMTWDDVAENLTPDIQVDDLSELTAFDIDPNNPQALLGVVLRVLQLLDDELRSGNGTGLLDAQVPLVDASLRDFLGADESGGGPAVTYPAVGGKTRLVDTTRPVGQEPTDARAFAEDLAGRSILIGTQVAVVEDVVDGQTLQLAALLSPAPVTATPYFLRSELADAITLLTADAPDTLQALVARLDERLGADSPVRFRTAPVDDAPALLVDVDWTRNYATGTPIKLDLLSGHTLAGAAADGQASIAVEALVDVDLVVPLDAGTALPTSLQVLDTSQVSVEAQASIDGSIRGSIGPLSLALGKPGATDAAEQAQARARYKLGFSKSGATGEPVSLADFLTTVAPTVNHYPGGVDCDETPEPTHDDLALCARLPLFVSSNGTDFTELAGVDDIALRLPKDGDTADELFGISPGRDVSDGDTRDRLTTPTLTQLEDAFLALLLDFGMIGDGIDAFLALIEDGLRAATLEGKLPLVGGDLQAGADFVGQLRTELDALFTEVESINGGKLPSVAEVQRLLDEEFRAALTAAGASPDDFSLDLTCLLPSTSVTSATASADGPRNLVYGVLTQGENGAGETLETTLPESGGLGTVTAADTATVGIAWDEVQAATGYTVVRSEDDGSTWAQVGEVDAGILEFEDTVATPGESRDLPTERALVATCDGVPMIDVQGVQIRADLGTGDPNATTAGGGIAGCETLDRPEPAIDKPCLDGTLPLDIGIPGLSLRAARGSDASPGGLTGQLGYRIGLALELDRENGLSLLTEEANSSGGMSRPEIAIGVDVDLTDPGSEASPALQAELAFLKIGVSKTGDLTVPAFAARFAVDLKAPGAPDCFSGCTPGTNDGRLDFADLQAADSASDVVRAQFDLAVHIEWFLKAEIESALPGVQAVLDLGWATSFDPFGASEEDKGDRAGDDLQIAFRDVAISAGGFLSQVLGPIVEQVKGVTGPLQPVIDTLYAPIPVLSDLSRLAGGGDVTLITLAKAFSTLADGPKLEFIDTVAALITFVNNLPTGDDSVVIPVGSFDVVGTAALATPATPDTGASLIDPNDLSPDVDLAQELDEKTTNGKKSLKGSGSDKSVAETAGFTFPVFENPGSVFSLLMGQDIELVRFDSGPMTLGFTWRQSFGPVYAPPPVFITLSGTASVTAHIVAGFDTYGIRKAFEADPDRSALAGIAQVLDGLYFVTTDEAGAPLPVITLFGEIAAGAAVSAVILTVGIEGGVRLTVAFSWNDPNGDGKFRLFEFGQVALRNPICLFQVSGVLSLFLEVYITIGFSPFDVSFDFTLVDLVLLDFSVTPDCAPPPPLLAGKSEDGTTLVLFAGKFGQGPRGDAAWTNQPSPSDHLDDVFQVTKLHEYEEGETPDYLGLRVTALGITEDFLDPALERVVVDGRGHVGELRVTFLSDGEQTGEADKGDKTPNTTSEFDLEVVAIGGDDKDVIKAGVGNALIDGRGGDDAITTSDGEGRNVRIAGGPGNDSITTGQANGIVAGDSTLGNAQTSVEVLTTTGATTLTGVFDWASPATLDEGSTGGDDRISVGLGRNTVYGGPGNDVVGVAADDPRQALTPPQGSASKGNTVYLGTGTDSFKGGSGPDTVWTATETDAARGTLDGAHGVDEPGAADGADARNIVDTGTGNDTVFGSDAVDLVTGGSGVDEVDHFRGGAGKDVLLGGLGEDALFGGPGDDWVVAEPATVSDENDSDEFGSVRSYTKTPLTTTPSSKLLVGGDGRDRVLGGDGASVLFGDRYETDPCGTPVDDPLSTQPVEPSEGAPGRDLVLGGAGIDKVKAGGQDDRVEAYGGNDLLCGQGGADVIFAGNDDDTVWAGSGADVAYGDAGLDSVFGNDDDDRLFAGDDADVVEGNDGADDLFGGRAADVLVGGTRAAAAQDRGRDEIYGDEGQDVLVGDNAEADGSYPVDLDGSSPSAGDADFLSGGVADDRAYGGLGGDEVNGDAGNDDLEGNLGRDTVRGGLGHDQVIGGSSEAATPGTGYGDVDDDLFGDAGNDVLTGDNAVVTRTDPAAGAVVLQGRGFPTGHDVVLLDLGYEPVAGTSGGDRIQGGADSDAIFGQSGADTLSGQDGADLVEGGPDDDVITGGPGQDDLVGGSSTTTDATGSDVGPQPDAGDQISGDNGSDLVLGDNGALRVVGDAHPLVVNRLMTPRGIDLLDLGDSADPRNAGNDLVDGGAGADILLAQAGDDNVGGGVQDDYLEGGPGSDLLQGQEGEDDLVGGSYTPLDPATHPLSPAATASGQPDGADQLRGGADDDVVAGDNAYLLRHGDTSRVSERLGSIDELNARRLVLLDRENDARLDLPATTRFGGDQLAGGSGVDLLYGQDGDDLVSGGGGDDYLQGNGGADLLRGDSSPEAVRDGVTTPAFTAGAWPAPPTSYDDGPVQADGQDDILGGSDARGFRDGGDTIEGNGGDDAALGDNGSLVRTVVEGAELLYTARGRSTVERIAEPGLLAAHESTRFCEPVEGRCEVSGAFGDDTVYGDGGDDGLWAQDGNDVLRGGAADDDVFGELGDDVLLGEAGEDVLLGDRGGVRNATAAGEAHTVSLAAVPAETYTAVRDGSYDRRVDLQNDTNGQSWLGTGTEVTMPLGGFVAGGRDRIRGGAGADQVHAGFGDDLANGDGGGDELFGDDGSDVLWGGKGCETDVAENPCEGADLAQRGTDDRFVDHLMGGRGGDPANPVLGADVLDWRPRGDYPASLLSTTSCIEADWPVEAGTGTTRDPCEWFRMTDRHNSDAADDQHHHGTDWIYGGWDRDVMQGDVAGNGPNPGDRLMDWNGTYNLWNHCNAAYGGFNDVRQHSPGMQGFLQALAYGMGAGRNVAEAETEGTSAFRELQLAYPRDKDHSTGKPYPSTPGHFDDPAACTA